jgi:hypothetical protein
MFGHSASRVPKPPCGRSDNGTVANGKQAIPRLALGVVVGLLAACGSKYGPGKTPRETIHNFEGALRDLDFGAAYDMMAPAARAKVDAQIRGAQRACAAVPEKLQEQFGLDDFVDATPREALAVAAKRVKKDSPEQAAQFKSLSLVVLDVKEYGETASVKVSMLHQGREANDRLKLVRVKGRWYFEDDNALARAAPMPIAPPMPVMTST